MYSPSQDQPRFIGISPGGAGIARPDRPAPYALQWKIAWSAAVLLLLVYAGYFASLRLYSFQDLPNHIARAAVLADLVFHHGQRFGGLFEFHPMFSPYILHDALLTVCVELLGTTVGAGAFTAIVFLSLPCALLFYLRVNALERAAPAVLLLSLYLATDSFFFMAFMGFRLAIALIVLCIGITDLLRRQWSRSLFTAYAVLLAAGYLTHLTSLVFFVPVLAVSGVLRLWTQRSRLRTELLLWIPVATLTVVHFGLVAGRHDTANPAAYVYFWGTVQGKLQELLWDFWRFGGRPNRTLMVLFAVCIAWAIRRDVTWQALRRPIVLEQLALAAVFFAVYWVLPGQYADSSYVDLRALPMIMLFLLFACLHLSGTPQSRGAFDSPVVVTLGVLLVAVNLGYLMLRLGSNDAWVSRYRAVAASVPPGAYVLPVNTLGAQRSIVPFLHAGSYLVLDRAAKMPYLFSGDRGDPMKFFRYRHRPYMPDEVWYINHQQWNKSYPRSYEIDGNWYTWRFQYSDEDRTWYPADLAPVEWGRVACTYDYLLVTMPYEAGYIRVATRRVASNTSAALLAVDKSACHTQGPQSAGSPAVRLPLEH